MGNFIRENIAKREMLAGKKEVIPIETKPSWELLAALYPDISVTEAPAHETHVSLRTEGAKWADGELFFPLFLFLATKSTHDPKAKKTHPQIPALPGRNSSRFQFDPSRHWHKSTDIAGAAELELNIPRAMLQVKKRLPPPLLAAVWSPWE